MEENVNWILDQLNETDKIKFAITPLYISRMCSRKKNERTKEDILERLNKMIRTYETFEHSVEPFDNSIGEKVYTFHMDDTLFFIEENHEFLHVYVKDVDDIARLLFYKVKKIYEYLRLNLHIHQWHESIDRKNYPYLFTHLPVWSLPRINELVKNIECMVPDRLSETYFINTPIFFERSMSMVKRMLPRSTSEKVHLDSTCKTADDVIEQIKTKRKE